MPRSAQQSGIGIASTNAGFGGFATVGGAVRITPAGVELEGAAGVNLTVAFIGVSGVAAMRAVSLRGATGAFRFSIGGVSAPGVSGEGGRVGGSGFAGGTDGFNAEGDGAAGFGAEGGGGSGVGGLRVEGGAGSVGAEGGVGKDSSDFKLEGGTGGFAAEGGGGNGGLGTNGGGEFGSILADSDLGGEIGGAPGGRTAFEETGAGGRTIGGVGGRRTGPPLGGRTGLGATKGGGGKTRGGTGEAEVVPGVGGRAGKLIRVVSFATGTVGRCVGRGGNVMRTVSFFGSFRSAISL